MDKNNKEYFNKCIKNITINKKHNRNKNDDDNTIDVIKAPFHLLKLSHNDIKNDQKSLLNIFNCKNFKKKAYKNNIDNLFNSKNISLDIKPSSRKAKESKSTRAHQRNNSMNAVLDQKKIDLFSKYFIKGLKKDDDKVFKKKYGNFIRNLNISQGTYTKKSCDKKLLNNNINPLDSKSAAMNCTSCSTKKLSGVNNSNKKERRI